MHSIAFNPRASLGFAAAMDGPPGADPAGIVEVLFWGSRASGKTILEAACLLGLAELHLRAGFDSAAQGDVAPRLAHRDPGQVAWAARIGPLLAVLGSGDGRGGSAFLLDPGPDCDALKRALMRRWHYDTTRGGEVERDAPAKNDPGYCDLGDALCYALGHARMSGAPRPPRDPHRPKPPRRVLRVFGARFHDGRRVSNPNGTW